jgi:hypothetical protein
MYGIALNYLYFFIIATMKSLFFGLLASMSLAHMEIKSHPPRTSKFSAYYVNSGKANYDLKNPLSTQVACINLSL